MHLLKKKCTDDVIPNNKIPGALFCLASLQRSVVKWLKLGHWQKKAVLDDGYGYRWHGFDTAETYPSFPSKIAVFSYEDIVLNDFFTA